MSADTEYTPGQLRGMDEDEAYSQLTMEQYERREQLLELHEQAEATEAEWEAEAETVADLTVRADPEQLGTEVDLFGNDVLVRVDPEDDDLQDAIQTLEAEFDDEDVSDVPEFDAERADTLADTLTAMLDTLILRWNGTPWDEVPEPQREAVLADAREAWGVDGLMLAWVDIAEAVNEDREEKVSAIESFRNEAGRGRR